MGRMFAAVTSAFRGESLASGDPKRASPCGSRVANPFRRVEAVRQACQLSSWADPVNGRRR
jgi:hypothetical protein